MMNNVYGFWALFVFWCGSLVGYLTAGGFAFAFISWSVGIVLACSVGVQLFSLNRIEFDRLLSGSRFFAGEDVVVTVRVRHRSFLPLVWLIVQDEWSQAGSERPFYCRRLVFPWFRSSFSYQYAIRRAARGEYEFRGFEAVTGDLFGLALKRKRAEKAERFTVYPKPLEVREWFAPAGDSRAGVVRPPAAVSGVQATGVRDYAYGDSPRRIHWKASAKTGMLKTKVTENEAPLPMMIFLEAAQSPSLPAMPDKGELLFEKRVQIAASLLKFARENRIEAGLLCNDAAKRAMRLSRHADLQPAYELLAGVKPDGSVPLHKLLKHEAAFLNRQTAIVCVTSALNEPLVETVRELHCQGWGIHIAFVYDSPLLSWHDREWARQLEAAGCAFSAFRLPRELRDGEGGALHAGA